MDHRFAQRLGRDRAGIDRGAAGGGVLFDDRDRFAKLRRLDGSLLAGRTCPDDCYVVVAHGSALHIIGPTRWSAPIIPRLPASRIGRSRYADEEDYRIWSGARVRYINRALDFRFWIFDPGFR